MNREELLSRIEILMLRVANIRGELSDLRTIIAGDNPTVDWISDNGVVTRADFDADKFLREMSEDRRRASSLAGV